MTGVHGLQHVEGLAATALTDDDALWPHTKRVDDKALDGDLALAVDVLGASLHAADMLLVELQLGRVLDGDDAVLHRDEAREHVEERGLAGARAARDDDVGLCQHRGLEETESSLVGRPESDQVVDLVGVAGELADRQQRAVQRQRPDHRVDAGAVGESSVTER